MEKYKVKANKQDLEDVGIIYDIDGLTGDLIRNYLTGWLCLKITHKIDSMEFTNEFDLPKYMCIPVF
jgi:hypothetical protein